MIANDEKIVVLLKDGEPVVFTFRKIIRDAKFGNFFVGFGYNKNSESVVYHENREFVCAFPSTEKNPSVSKVLDEVINAIDLVGGMKKISSTAFWTDSEVVGAFKKKYEQKRQMISRKEKEQKYDILEKLEEDCVSKYLEKKQSDKKKSGIGTSKFTPTSKSTIPSTAKSTESVVKK